MNRGTSKLRDLKVGILRIFMNYAQMMLALLTATELHRDMSELLTVTESARAVAVTIQVRRQRKRFQRCWLDTLGCQYWL